MIGYDEGIKLVLYDSGGEVIFNILVNVNETTLGIYFVTDIVSLDGSLDGSNFGNFEVLLIVDSLGSTDGKLLGSYEGIKLGSNDVEVIGTILENAYGITLGLDVGTELGWRSGYDIIVINLDIIEYDNFCVILS